MVKRLIGQLRRYEEHETLMTRLLVLLGIGTAATLISCAAAGALHFRLFNGLVALVAAVSTVASLPKLRGRFISSAAPAPAAPASPTPSLDRTKKILVLVMLAGAIAYIGGRATFALFSAETTNSNSSMASGTLTMGNQVYPNPTVCMSSSGATNDNVNAACNAFLSLQNMAPGVSSAQAKLTIENDGSIDASKFYVFAPYPRTTLSGALTSGVAVASLQVSGFGVPVALNDHLIVSYGGHSQTFTVTAAVAGASTITVSGSPLANFSYPVGARVDDTSADTSATNTDCYDAKTTTTTVAGSSIGTDLNFNDPTGNPLCSSLIFWIQEQTSGGANYCWSGLGSSGSSPSAVGQCRTPTTPSLSTTLSTGGAITSLPVQVLAGNIASGDSLTITEGAHTQTVTASGNAFINDAAIPVNSFTPNFAYTSAATITDTTAFGALNGDPGDTISQFDTGHLQTGRIQLYPVTGNNAVNTTATIELNKHGSAGYQRVFYIGVYMPAPAGTPQNALQGLVSTFGLSWHIDQ